MAVERMLAVIEPRQTVVNIFVSVILGAVAALAAIAAIADSSNGTQRYYEVRGAKLYTQIYGHGPPIVFLHGGMVFFDNSFAKQRDYFSAFRTVIGIDQRGHGHSPDGPWSLSYKMMADDTAAIIEKLGLGPVDIVGHSDGADLALVLTRLRESQSRRSRPLDDTIGEVLRHVAPTSGDSACRPQNNLDTSARYGWRPRLHVD
jgi:hypothetical protein